MWVCVFVGLLLQKLKIACIDPHQTGFVGKVVTISSWLNFGPPAPPREGGLRQGKFFWLSLTTADAQCLHLSEHFFHSLMLYIALFNYITYYMEPVSEMTYTVSSGTLNSTIPYYTIWSRYRMIQTLVFISFYHAWALSMHSVVVPFWPVCPQLVLYLNKCTYRYCRTFFTIC